MGEAAGEDLQLREVDAQDGDVLLATMGLCQGLLEVGLEALPAQDSGQLAIRGGSTGGGALPAAGVRRGASRGRERVADALRSVSGRRRPREEVVDPRTKGWQARGVVLAQQQDDRRPRAGEGGQDPVEHAPGTEAVLSAPEQDDVGRRARARARSVGVLGQGDLEAGRRELTPKGGTDVLVGLHQQQAGGPGA